MSPRRGTVGALGGKYHIRQEGGLENVIPSCKMGTASDTGCGEDDEVMYVKCQQKCMVFLNVLIRSNINSWIIYFPLRNKLTSKLYRNPITMVSLLFRA